MDTRLASAPISSYWAVVPLQAGSRSEAVCSCLQARPFVFWSRSSSPFSRLVRFSPGHVAALLSPGSSGCLLVTWQLSSFQARSVVCWSRGSSSFSRLVQLSPGPVAALLSPNSFYCIPFLVTSYTPLLFRAPRCCAIWKGNFYI